ncbi:type II secretion system F family protein [Mariniblastus fucicola]|uniref:Bacterial type II secretion system protein F domain protein n=1 Tax=Mariniblastus fucicola TaxID=980251 RepID=A0A5B9P9M5_9BACT|nr:type II secretion system F family protein [Mariniblastus fucicola]QEG22159.1 Bacterial type II secretion system protein F domain protein [Mariniblastus fucicola]
MIIFANMMLYVTPIAIFVAIAVGLWLLFDTFLNGQTRSESRLDAMRRRARGEEEEVDNSNSAREGINKLLTKASPKLSSAIQPKNEQDVNKLKVKLDSAGFRGEKAVEVFLSLQVLSGLFGLFMGGIGSILVKGFSTTAVLYACGIALLFFLLPGVILSILAGKRKEKIFLGLPDALDLMVVCVEAGLGQDQALRRVSEELEKAHPIIAGEFNQCNHQLQMGKTREHVLQELAERNDVEDLNTLANVLIQVDRFGTSVGKALRTQSDAMRVRRKQIAEEKASKTAVALIFPLVLCIFPGIFVVLVGPAAITMVKELLPTMGT